MKPGKRCENCKNWEPVGFLWRIFPIEPTLGRCKHLGGDFSYRGYHCGKFEQK